MLNCLIGRRETGKTTLAMYGARHTNRRRLVFDPSNRIYPRGAGIKAYDVEELVQAYGLLLNGDSDEVIYTPRVDGVRTGFFDFAEVVHVHVDTQKRRGVSVVIDEGALVEKQLDDPEHPISKAMTWARRERNHFFITCHQPKNIPTSKRAITDLLVFFRVTQEHDLEVIRDRCSDAFAAKVARLQPFQYLLWNDQATAERPCYLLPSDWKLDLSEQEIEIDAENKVPLIDRGSLWR
jgi:hypothetical protein